MREISHRSGDDGATASGTLYVWGTGQYGQLGCGTAGTAQPTPTAVSLPSRVLTVSAGWWHSIAVCGDVLVPIAPSTYAPVRSPTEEEDGLPSRRGARH